MNLEPVIVAIVFCVAVFPLVAVFGQVKVAYRPVIISIVVLWSIFPIAFVVLSLCNTNPVAEAKQVTGRPIEEDSNGYVGSKSCRSCHPHQHDTWHSSYHRTMTQIASPRSVMGDFENRTLTVDNLNFQLSRKGDEYWADMEINLGPEFGNRIVSLRNQIVMVTGSHHMQAYWFEIHEDSRVLGMFPFMYLKDEQRWALRNATHLTFEGRTAGDEAGRWNKSCIQCHTTYGRMNAQRSMDGKGHVLSTADSRVAEFGIACEACHGPGEAHVRANRSPTRRYARYLSDAPEEDIVQPSRLDHRRSTHVCGQCHGIHNFRDNEVLSEWIEKGYRFRPGDDLSESEMRFLVRYDLDPIPPTIQKQIEELPDYLDSYFWSDGMVRVTGREYNGLVNTPCYQQGTMSCLSCHQMHQSRDDPRLRKDWADDQLKLEMTSNRACTQCHAELEEDDKLADHTHHSSRSSGSNCYNCHMPHTTYGLLKAIRSHTIDSPSVASSLATGRPNACNQCHLDKTLDWTARHLSQWYGHSRPKLSDDEREIAASILWILRGDAGQRALMAWSFGWETAKQVSGSQWMAPYLAQLLEDPYDANKLIAHSSLLRLPGFDDFQHDPLGPLENNSSANQNAVEKWNRQRKPGDRPLAATVLIGDGGKLLREPFERLLSQRDDKPIHLQE